MKKLVLFGLLLVTAVACDKKEDATPEIVQLGSTVVSYQKQSNLKTSGEDISVKLLEVQDSRCPANANCVWAGAANVKFNVSEGSDQTDVLVVFSSADKNSGVQEFRLGNHLYNLKVTQVLPYPEISKTPELEEYQISVSIEKK